MNQEVVLIAFQIGGLVLAFSVNESAPRVWGWGRGRNSLKHVDPAGSVVIPIISMVYGGWLIGWAKPCPVTTRNFRNIKRDDILTSLAGPASNLAMATGSLVLLIV